MRCIFCDSESQRTSFKSIFVEEDKLCYKCRKLLKINIKNIKIDNKIIETIYNYDEGIFRDLLIQYKECFDEALAPLFLYSLTDYIHIKYHGYKLLFVPSSKEKRTARGFNHLELIFKDIKLKRVVGLNMKDELIQEGKNYNQRRQMLNNYIYQGEMLDKVLIVDDVVTTGSSVLGVYHAIAPYVKKVSILVLSRKENAFILKNKCV